MYAVAALLILALFPPLASAAVDCAAPSPILTGTFSYMKRAPGYALSKGDLGSFYSQFERFTEVCPREAARLLQTHGYSSAGQMRDALIEKWQAAKSGPTVGPLLTINYESTLESRDEALEEIRRLNASPETQERVWAMVQQAHASSSAGTRVIQNLDISECSDVDLRPKLQSGNSQLCASYMVADLMTIELGKPVSPLSLAVGIGAYTRGFGRPEGVGAEPSDEDVERNANAGRLLFEPLLTSMGDVGYCLSSEIGSGSTILSRSTGTDEERALFETSDEQLLEALLKARDPAFFSETQCTVTSTLLSELFPGRNAQDLHRIAVATQGNLMTDRFNACKRTLPPAAIEKLQLTYFDLGAHEREKQALSDKLLNTGGIVGSMIHAGIYTDPEKNADAPPQHAISLVGRRKNPATGKCEYMVRDSIGAPPEMNSAFTRVDRNHVWAPAEILFKSVPHMLHRRLP